MVVAGAGDFDGGVEVYCYACDVQHEFEKTGFLASLSL